MPLRRRGSKGAIHVPTWTQLFHRIATGVLEGAVHGTEIVIIPAMVAKSAVHYLQKNADKVCEPQTHAAITSHKSEEGKINNKKEDLILLNTVKIEDNAENLNGTDTEHLGETFVFLDRGNHESYVWPPKIEDKVLKELDIGYKVVQRENPEQKIPGWTKCTKSGHNKTTCEMLSQTKKEPDDTNVSGSNSITDLGYNSIDSNNFHQFNESISKANIFSSSTNLTTNSPSLEEEFNQSSESAPKETFFRSTLKLGKELKEIKKEVEHIKFELKINVAKKVDSNFLHVSLQGIPPEIKNENIVNDLKSKQFFVKNVYRLRNDENKVTDKISFELPKEQDHIFYLSCCLGFDVRVEEYKGDSANVKNSPMLCDASSKDASPRKPINVLFSGIPKDISETDILRDLMKKQIHPIAVHSMIPTKRYLGETKNVLVQVPSEENHIYSLSCILGFPVSVIKGLDKGTLNIAQCKTCLQFGHSSVMCSGKINGNVESNYFKECEITADIPVVNAVVKGVPIEFDDNMVLNDFIQNGFSPIAIHRMIINDEILPTYLVQVREHEKRILMLTCCLGFSVKTEQFLPHLYSIEQCKKCWQFGGHNKECTVNKRMNLSDKIEEYVPASTSTNLKCKSNDMQLEQRITSKLDNLEVILKEFIKKNNEEVHKLCSCNNVTEISKHDAWTSTDNAQDQIVEMTEAVNSYENISAKFMKNMGLFAKAIPTMSSDNIMEEIKAYLTLTEISGMTAPFIEAMIRILRSATNLMVDIPNLPGVSIHSLNEQMHLLEELTNIKESMDGITSRFTGEYDVHFPKLE